MLRKFAGVMFDKLVSNSKKYKGSLWEQKKNESSEFYDWLNQKFMQYEDKLKK
ncbi:unnamed protein product [Paramecium sonneborni]|uniref:Uncharacterized protein n=1 Tax=Paramecium sonneborni TaxID=65129 RepID=A0A8S1QAS4_9CILI|nr:unnamed protein product [Paramecium sonneborni]